MKLTRSGEKNNKKYVMLIAVLLVILIVTSTIWMWLHLDNKCYTNSEETGIVSGRILYDNILLKPVYNASVLVNGKPAEIYGTTYLATNVSSGEVILEAHDNEGQTVKETLIVEPSVVNSADLIFSVDEEGTPPNVTSTTDYLQFNWENGISMKLNITDDRLLGIGEVNIDGIPLRKPLLTESPKIEKIENGSFVRISYRKCQFIDYETKGEAVIVRSKLVTMGGDIDLDWIFTPWTMEVEENQYKGLGYRFSIFSPVNISKMEFKCSWELNGDIVGKTLYTRQAKTSWERLCTTEGFTETLQSYFSTSQPPTYQYDSSGSLSTFIYPPGELLSTFQKDSGGNQLIFIDEFSFGETKQVDTPFRVVLYAKKSGLNEYTYLFDQISEDYRNFYGLEEVTPIPSVLASSYLNIDQPGVAPAYRSLADNWLSIFKEHNFKELLIIYIWLSNGRIGSPYNENRHATFSINIYPDDVSELKYLVTKTHNLDMYFTAWLSVCYSMQSPLYEKYNWQIQNVDGSYPGAPSGDVYLMSYRSGYLAYALEKLKMVKEEFGFDGIWHDFFGMSSIIDYSDKNIKPSIDQQMQFLSATQKMGYTPFLEALGPFGITATGSIGVSETDQRAINAQFGGREYLAYKTAFVLFHPDDFNPLQVDYYKFLASKAVPKLAYPRLSESEKAIVSQSNKDYNAVVTYMDKRVVLSNDNGILWYDKESNTLILFAYNEFSYDLEGDINEVFDITNNSNVEIINGSFTTQTKHTYKLQ